MSYSTNRRDALDPTLPIAHRMSHARSCAMLMSQKFRVPRSAIIDLVRQSCGVDLASPASKTGIVEAIGALDRIKAEGVGAASDATA